MLSTSGALNALGTFTASAILDILDMTIKDIDAGSTTDGFNNDTNNEIDTSALETLAAAIKDIDIKSITSKINNNIDTEVDASVFMYGVISKTDAELTMSGFYKANTIIKKKYVNLICSWLLLISNRSLVSKIVLLRILLSK